jgi:hypothetical protein
LYLATFESSTVDAATSSRKFDVRVFDLLTLAQLSVPNDLASLSAAKRAPKAKRITGPNVFAAEAPTK